MRSAPVEIRALLALLALSGCARVAGAPRAMQRSEPAIPPRVAASFPEGWKYPAGQHATFAPHAMVASNNLLAARAGAEILRAGGNAIDAAVATGFALAVTFPQAGNLGGGGFMLIRMADGRTAALDYREVAPLAATRDMYVGADGKVTTGSLRGPLASGVPGAVAGMTEALRKWGTLPLARVVAPAIRLAEDGFIVDSVFAASIRENQSRIGPFAGATLFLPNSSAPKVGTLFRQPNLARTLRLIASEGAEAFYTGEIANEIADEMRRDGGLITREDLRRYRALWRTPLRTSYRDHTLLMMPPSSSGGITIGEALNILEVEDSVPAPGSASELHLLASAYQRAFIDRNAKLGDPAFVSVPVSELLDKDYARRLATTIGRSLATPTRSVEAAMTEGTETTHFSVVDVAGNAVATTTTLNELYGSGVYVAAAGFFLNDEMDDFTVKPGSPNTYGLIQGERNSIAPGKRMLSAMSPAIVLDPAGQLLLVLGARGGPRIITSVSQVIRNVIDLRMSLADAMNAPRIHHQARPDSLKYDSAGYGDETLAELRRMGYALKPMGYIGASVTAIMRVRGGFEGADDPRGKGGGAIGY
jgi:gamma-glutamyltranspeptidase / glutathione hydrolase